MVIVTHEMNFAGEVADRVFYRPGDHSRVRHTGADFNHPQNPRTAVSQPRLL